MKNIEDIEVGDYVYSKNTETGEEGYKEVLQLYVNETDVLVDLTIGETKITTTATHPFYVVGEGFKNASELKRGEKVITASGETRDIVGVEIRFNEEPVVVYNFEVADWHTYYVSDDEVLVHNMCQKGSTGSVDYYVMPNGDVIPNGTCIALGLPGEPAKMRSASQLQADADAIHSAIVTSSGAPDIKAQTNRTTTVTQGFDANGNVIHTVTNSSGVVSGTQKAVARQIYGDDVRIPTRSQVPVSNNINSHHGEQQGIRFSEGQTGRTQASSSGAKHGGAACGPCSVAQAEAGVVNVTGVQVSVGGKGRIFPN